MEAGSRAATTTTSASRGQGPNVTRSPTLARTGSCLGPDADLLALRVRDGLAAGRLAQPGTEVVTAVAGVGHEGRTGRGGAHLPVEVARRSRPADLDVVDAPSSRRRGGPRHSEGGGRAAVRRRSDHRHQDLAGEG